MKKQSKNRIYVCHTIYHVYVTVLKELNLPQEQKGQATIVLSRMSNDFGDVDERLRKSGIFEDVLFFDEKNETFFTELEQYHTDKGNIAKNLFQRMKFCKLYAKYEEPYIPVDFKAYKNIYVFCDSDPIGYYLNYKKIHYHAVEDGLDCIRYYDTAHYDNRGCFRIKAFLASLNLIFIQNGYSKYCLDMEVNDISVLQYPYKKYIEQPREELVKRLSGAEQDIIVHIFVKNIEALMTQLQNLPADKEKILILTEPLCTLDVREQIFKDIIETYGQNGLVIMKPHPRDLLDYETIFNEHIILDGKFPMEILNFIPDLVFDKVITVFTPSDAIHFAKEKIILGEDFMDQYEAPEIHRQNELI
ncbi:MAG: lipooligosaccharide sialyltransferase [Lachnospiraceae bacterium]|nr:lipooligosaccharide sialyltransferase [Lachnospiraceae bacterium]